MLCYNAVTCNPDPECNPQLGDDDALSAIIGVGLTIVCLGYVGWSTTADKTLGGSGKEDTELEATAYSSCTACKSLHKDLPGLLLILSRTSLLTVAPVIVGQCAVRCD
jgi:hypothetical protein